MVAGPFPPGALRAVINHYARFHRQLVYAALLLLLVVYRECYSACQRRPDRFFTFLRVHRISMASQNGTPHPLDILQR
ncbi:hypothetical protein F5Y15DRAFT_365451 [Xylariaceae sp. FL0016]|nr:hypothetical protein F5Y15DRAFT_365451 [Xylariaceae sp. FL0016]